MKKNINKHILVIDIGGTNFRTAIFNNETEKIADIQRFPTPNFINHPNLPINKLQQLLIKQIQKSVKQYQEKYNFTSIGVSFPAPITSAGVAKQAPTMWGKKGKNYPILNKLIQAMSDYNWIVANDITAAAERYAHYIDVKQNLDFFCIITVSSGVGHKIYDLNQRKVIIDRDSIGGELGHVKYDMTQDAALCDCGSWGHIGAVSSGRAIEKLFNHMINQKKNQYQQSELYKLNNGSSKVSNEIIVKAIQKKDPFSIKLLDSATLPIAYSINFLTSAIGIKKFIIVGGFALNCGPEYIKSLKKNIKKFDFFGMTKKEIANLVELGVGGGEDPLIGMGYLVDKKYPN